MTAITLPMTGPGSIPLIHLRFAAFIAAIVLYAFAGSPTPDNPGMVEAVVGILLACSVGLPFLARSPSEPVTPGHILLLYGMIVPVLIAAVSGANPGQVVRDLIAFMFLCLPVFALSLIGKSDRRFKVLTIAIAGCGMIFAARALAGGRGYLPEPGELFYLANAPSVLFAALLVLGLAGRAVFGSMSLRSLLTALAFSMLFLIPFLAMVQDVQRAPFGALVITFGFLVLAAIWKAPHRAIVVFAVLTMLAMAAMPYLTDITWGMVDKTAHVGLNMRLHELRAVIDAAGQNPIGVIFGLGWGADYVSPAVGGLSVPFTHSLLTYMLLKTGVFGLCLTVFYIWTALSNLASSAGRDLVLSLALFWPVVIPVFLYASYKSFDFGLILLLSLLARKEKTV